MGGDAEVSYTFGVGPTISEDHLCGRDQRGCDRASETTSFFRFRPRPWDPKISQDIWSTSRVLSSALVPTTIPQNQNWLFTTLPSYLMRRQFLPVLPQWLAPHLRSPARHERFTEIAFQVRVTCDIIPFRRSAILPRRGFLPIGIIAFAL